jgi:hypothetical protein
MQFSRRRDRPGSNPDASIDRGGGPVIVLFELFEADTRGHGVSTPHFNAKISHPYEKFIEMSIIIRFI